MRWFLFLVPLLACECQPLPADLLLLVQVKTKMMENLAHLPNYTCAETVERGQRLLPSKKYHTHDVVRLEVALVDGHEMYGWPGSNRIAESELSSLVGGTIGNGDFGLLVRSIFLSSGAIFHYIGSENNGSRTALRWTYRVPLLSSGYRLRVPPNEAVVGYHGSFRVDPESFDLVSLDLAADDIPEVLGLQASTKVIEYQRVNIGSLDFLLPKTSDLAMSDFNGVESRNRTTFHDCRQYSGESVLSFDDPPPEIPKEAAPQLLAIDLPENFTAQLSLITPINSETAAVGDPIQVKLEENVRSGHKLIAPKGAILSGRILQLHRRQQTFHLAFSLHSLDFNNSHADLSGRENTIFAVNEIGASPMQFNSQESFTEKHSLIFEAVHLHLPKGLLLYLHSRLLKSDKQ